MLAFRLQLRLSGSTRPSLSQTLSHTIPRSCLVTMADLDATSLAAEIDRQKALFNDLRINPATPVAALEQAKKQLGDLQRALGVLKKKEEKKDGAEQDSKDPTKKKERLLLKTAKVGIFQEISSRAHHISGHTRLFSCRNVLQDAP